MAAVVLLHLLSVATASAATITIATSSTFSNPPRNFLRTLDTDTLALSPVTEVTGVTGQLTDIAYDPSGALYGISFSNLYRIDEATGVATDIGRTLQFVETMNALAFDAAGTLYAASGSSSTLFTLDLATGAATQAGFLPGGLPSSGDLAFDDNGVLWGTASRFGQGDRLVRLNPGGVGTEIGDLGRQLIYGLAFAEGTLYGIGGQLYEIDRATGTVLNETGSYSFVQGASFLPVPEAGTLCLLLGGLAVLAARRERT